MSGSFVQRGEPAIADKYGRAAAAVRSGADVVLELPFPWSCGSARYFAAAGIYILNALGVKNIAFGSECADADMLRAAAEAAPEDIRTDTAATGAAAGYFAALNERLGGASRLMPNDILGVEYMRAARVLGTGTDFTVVRREGAGFNDIDPDADIPSASALRTAVREGRLPHGLCDASAEMLRDAEKTAVRPPICRRSAALCSTASARRAAPLFRSMPSAAAVCRAGFAAPRRRAALLRI